MSKEIECPYCEHLNYDDDVEFRGEDELHEMQCAECEKNFLFRIWVHFSYNTTKADCLNGSQHDYAPTKTVPREYARVKCTICETEDFKATHALRAERLAAMK